MVVTAVMVEVSTKVPKTGGLIFLPLQTSGPLFATLVAAGVWGFYAANPAGECTAMVKNLAAWGTWPALFNHAKPTWAGIGLGVFFLVLITALNLLKPRRFLMVNNVLTAFKIFVPLLVVVLLCCALDLASGPPGALSAGCPARGRAAWPQRSPLSSAAACSTPILAFRGRWTSRGTSKAEASARRHACAGHCTARSSARSCCTPPCRASSSTSGTTRPGAVDDSSSVYTAFAGAVVRPGWLASLVTGLINLDSVLSPAGTAMVFTYVMTREVAALSRAHLTHRGLQRSKNSVIRLPKGFLRAVFDDDRLDVYWRILLVDFVISLVMLLFTRGYLPDIQNIPTILALLVYATPSIALAALRQREPGLFPKRRYAFMAQVSFAALAVVFVVATGGVVPWGMGTLATFCLVLFGLPVVAPMARWYDARAHVREFGALRTNTGAQLAGILGGYFGLLTIAELVRSRWPSRAGVGWDIVGLAVVVAISVIAFRWLVQLSVTYMGPPNPPPLLPKPLAPPVAPDGTTEAGS